MKKSEQNTPSIARRTLCRTLDNGLKIYVCPRPGSGTVFSQAVVRTGSIHEGENLGCGLSHFLEHMAFSGTETHPGHTAIADRVNRLGGVLNASTSYERTQYYIEMPAGAETEAIDMLYGMIALPLFPEERFQNEKGAILRECSMYRDSPGSVLFERLMQESLLCYPARVPIIGYQSKIETVDREMMRNYWGRRYSPCRTAFVIVGDVDAEKTAEYIEKKAGGWGIGCLDEPVLPAEPLRSGLRRIESEFSDPLAWIALGFHEPARNDGDFIANDVFGKLLAGLDSARLVRELKLKRGLADQVAVSQVGFPDLSLGYVAVTAAPEKSEETISVMREVIGELETKPVEKAELDRIAVGMERSYWDVFRKNSGLGGFISQCFVYRMALSELDGYAERVRGITPDDIMRVARKYHGAESGTLVRQMPAGKQERKTFSAAAGNDAGKPDLVKLKSGQRLVIGTSDELPIVEFSFFFPAGRVFETKRTAGVADLADAVYGCATQDYTEEELNRILDDNAMTLSTECGADCFIIRGGCMKDQVPLLTKLLESVLARPAYPDDIIEREREMLLRDLECDETDPQEKAMELARCAIFGANHPAGFSGGFVRKNAAVLGRKELMDFCGRMFDPKRTVASVSGAIGRAEAEKCLRGLLAAVPWTESPPAAPPEAKRRKPGVTCRSGKLDREQSVVLDAFPCPGTAELTAGMRLAFIASSGMSSRLFKQVREQRGLAYYTGIAPSITRYYGWAAYYAGTRPGAESEVLRLFEEDRRLRCSEGLTEEEIEGARARMKFSIRRSLQDRIRLAEECARKEYCGDGADYFWRRLAELDAVSQAEVNEDVRKLFSAPFRVMSVVSPEKISDFPDFSD